MEISEKKKAIIESALVLITEKGFHGCPMSQVASNASVAAGTIYHYFPSKDEMIKEIYAYVRASRMKVILSSNDPGKNFKERFFNLWENLYNFYVSNPKTIFFLEQYVNSPYFKCQCMEYKESFYSALGKFLQPGIDEKILREMDHTLMASLIHSSILILAKNQLLGILQVNKEKLTEALNYTWNGLKA